MYEIFCNCDGETVIRFITNYLGMQILTPEMAESMIDECLCTEEDLTGESAWYDDEEELASEEEEGF